MNEEAGFLSAIRQNPPEETARLAYADWLDEQGDPGSTAKADFIRLEVRMATAPEQSLNSVRLLGQLKKLARDLEADWLAVVSHPRLEACRLRFEFECPKQWGDLRPTADAKKRFCASCKKHVHYCETLEEAQNHAAQGHCVAVSLALVRRPFDLHPPRPGPPRFLAPGRRTLGKVLPRNIRRTAERTLPAADPPPTPPVDPAPDPAPPRRQPRKKGRNRNRNLQRENWEDQE